MDYNAATEWGLPDWQNQITYGAFADWSLSRWRWEFLRRRPDLRAEFDEVSERHRDTWKKYLESPLSHDQPGFFIPSYRINPNFPNKDRPLPLPLFNPRISEQPEDALHWNDWMQGHFAFVSEEPPANYLRIDFDLREPITAQLAVAKARLLDEQRKRFGHQKQRRRHPEKWIGYIMVLDAREGNFSWDKIAEILPHTARTPQSARDVWEQAQALCFNF